MCISTTLNGPDFDFDETLPKQHWRWFEFVAQLDDESIAYVAKGHENRSCGLKECWLSMRPGGYDHKRQVQLTAQRRQQAPLPVWDFLIVRDDGSRIRLHPNYKNTKVDVIESEGHSPALELPRRGVGASDGPGTFAYYKQVGVLKTLQFDPNKRKRPQAQRLP